jgi:hypothetical protein
MALPYSKAMLLDVVSVSSNSSSSGQSKIVALSLVLKFGIYTLPQKSESSELVSSLREMSSENISSSSFGPNSDTLKRDC